MGAPPTIEFASLGMADSLILMVMALVVFGPRRLPQIGRQIGKLMYEFRKASNDFKYQMEEELRIAEEADRRKQEEARALSAPAPAAAALEPATTSHLASVATHESPTEPAVEESDFPTIHSTGEPAAEVAETAAGLKIQPPSVGEQVPGGKSWRLEEALAKLAEPALPETDPAHAEVAEIHPAETTPTAEQNHHG